ncbi:PEP-CTERM sorting domain-containing protein [Microcoleus sp. C2C3]|uniref:PEP-CTERM sorting domain-containing protein n=1 Tax=unclassified Microcoleus TaxID=2642155 RepID=UPI002FD1EE1B
MIGKFSLNAVLPTSILLTTLCGADALAFTLATQDLFIIDTVRIASGGMEIDLAPTLISNALSSPESTVLFAGGATFTSTSAFPGKVVDINNVILGNTTVIPGVLSFGGNQFFSILTSSDLDALAETLGISDSVELDLTTVFPTDVNVGDVGRMDYTMIQLGSPSDPSSESGLSPLEVAVSRSNEGLVFGPSLDNMTLAEIFDQPFVVSQGSLNWKFIAKGLVVAGVTAKGALKGAAVGSTVPGLGTGIGAALGGGGSFLISSGAAVLANIKGDKTPDPKFTTIIPDPGPAVVPEPLTIFGSLMALGGGALLKRKHSKGFKKAQSQT